ncbi:hypothetical protein JCM8547_003294 [Rhodosporidiobolus lusitaniae]
MVRPEPPRKTSSSSSNGTANGGGRKLVKNSRRTSTLSPPPHVSASSPSPSPPIPRTPYPPAPSRSPYPLVPPQHLQQQPFVASPPISAFSSPPPSFPPQPTQNSYNPALHRTPSSPYPPVGAAPPMSMPRPFGGSVRAPAPPVGAAHAPVMSGRASSVPPVLTGGQQDQRRRSERDVQAEQEEAELSRILAESASLERARLRADQDSLSHALEASTHDRLRSEALQLERAREEERAVREAVERSREAEERRRREREEREKEEVRRVVEETRRRAQLEEEAAMRAAEAMGRGKGKGKGKAREEDQEVVGVSGVEEEDAMSREERETLEYVKQLSLRDAQTSAQAFERFSRPAVRRSSVSAPAAVPTSSSTFASSSSSAVLSSSRSTSQHPLFDHPASSPPRASSSSSAVLSASPPHASSSSSSHHLLFATDFPDDLPPPAYEYPAHAPENDEPGDVIVGPGRLPSLQPSLPSSAPLPPRPSSTLYSHSSSSAPHPPVGAAPPMQYRRPSPFPLPTSSAAAEPGVHPLFSSDPPRTASTDSYSSSAATFEVGGGEGGGRRTDSIDAEGAWKIGSAGSFSDASTTMEPSRLPSVVAKGEDEAEEDPFGDEHSIFPRQEEGGHEEDERDAEREQPVLRERDDLFSLWNRRASTVSARPAQPDLESAATVSLSSSPSLVSSPPATTEDDEEDEQKPTPTATVASPLLPSPSSAVSTFTSNTVSSPPVSPPLLSPPPTASTSTFTSSTSSLTSSPSHGGFVTTPSLSAPPFARDEVLEGVSWGFVEHKKAALGPMAGGLEFGGDFPRGAQMSARGGGRGEEEGKGEGRYGCFAVEAGGWQSLLVYLMWHGNSRLEASPSDLELDKLNRGLSCSVSLAFFRSFTAPQAPRIRVTLTLLPLSSSSSSSSAPPVSHSAAGLSPFSMLPLDPPTFSSSCPSIRLALSQPLPLPLALSQLASTLSHAHTLSRQTLRVVQTGVVGGSISLSGGAAGLLSDRAALAKAVDLFRRLTGERGEGENGGQGGGGEDAEVGLMVRLKARLRMSRKVRVLQGGSAGQGGVSTGAGRVGGGGGGALPEGASLITPFSID